MTQKECRDTIRTCWDWVSKVKAYLELNTVREVKGIKKGFYRYSSSKRKIQENVGPLINGARNVVKKDMEKAKLLHAFFTSVSTGKSWATQSSWPCFEQHVGLEIASSPFQPQLFRDCMNGAKEKHHLESTVLLMVRKSGLNKGDASTEKEAGFERCESPFP